MYFRFKRLWQAREFMDLNAEVKNWMADFCLDKATGEWEVHIAPYMHEEICFPPDDWREDYTICLRVGEADPFFRYALAAKTKAQRVSLNRLRRVAWESEQFILRNMDGCVWIEIRHTHGLALDPNNLQTKVICVEVPANVSEEFKHTWAAMQVILAVKKQGGEVWHWRSVPRQGHEKMTADLLLTLKGRRLESACQRQAIAAWQLEDSHSQAG